MLCDALCFLYLICYWAILFALRGCGIKSLYWGFRRIRHELPQREFELALRKLMPASELFVFFAIPLDTVILFFVFRDDENWGEAL